MNTEEEYRKIGKAIIDEFMERADERCITVALRSVQYDEKFHIMMGDRREPLTIWKYTDLEAVRWANRQQGARERAEERVKEIRDTPVPDKLLRILMVTI